MELVYNEEDLRRYMSTAIEVTPDRPVLVDRFLEDAIEVDVDCIADGETSVIGAIMEHIEEAGIHSGDSACVIPTFSLSKRVLEEISAATKAMARELKVRGLMNVQFAIKGDDVYVLEVNPRASRTVPFVSKAIGVPLAKIAAKVMVGQKFERNRFHPGNRSEALLGQRGGLSIPAIPRDRHFVRPGNEIDRRSHGNRRRSRARLRQVADGRAAAVADRPETFSSASKTRDKEAIVPVAREFVKLGFRRHRHQRNSGRAD